MKTKITGLLITIIAIFGFTGCDVKQQVPAGYYGKILDKQGWMPEVLPSGWYTVCGFSDFTCYKELKLIQTSEGQFKEKVTIRMKDNMNLVADYIRVRVKVKTDKNTLNAIFNTIPPKNNVITLKQVYDTYGKLIITRDVREILSKYKIDDVRLNYSKITAEIYKKIKEDFKHTPLQLLDFNVGRFNYPEVYDKAIVLAKKRELEIKQIEADNIIKLKKIQAQEAIAKAQYNIKMQEAKRIADYNKMIGNSVTEKLIKLRQLEVQQSLVENLKNNQNVVYMPIPMIENNKLLMQLPNKNNK